MLDRFWGVFLTGALVVNFSNGKYWRRAGTGRAVDASDRLHQVSALMAFPEYPLKQLLRKMFCWQNEIAFVHSSMFVLFGNIYLLFLRADCR
jgi:hypothetical protein